ncbi:MAG: hypothetical protein K9K79_01530 [Desulfohalobiaceae bacterium]|nr:hypothetical protein [Desulfohalobiaceae bacterium]
MRLSCQECNKSLNLPQDRIPDKGSFRFSCPVCGAKNKVDLPGPGESRAAPPEQAAENRGPARKKTVEPELFPPGSKVALLSIQDQGWLEQSKDFLTAHNFYLSSAESPEQGAQKLRLNRYQLVLIEQGPRSEVLLGEISRWPGRYRREVNCILLGENGKSFDPYAGFLQGVNSYLSKKDGNQAKQLLEQARDSFAKYLEPWHQAANQETGT